MIYQVHVSLFFRCELHDGIGDLQGLIEKLDYIAGIGCAIPSAVAFYPSPRR